VFIHVPQDTTITTMHNKLTSLHDALPISRPNRCYRRAFTAAGDAVGKVKTLAAPIRWSRPPSSSRPAAKWGWPRSAGGRPADPRSEEHTSELQSREKLVCRLLREKNTEFY